MTEIRKRLPSDHPLYVSHDPDGYVRFKSAVFFDTRKNEARKYLKRMFFGYKYDPSSSIKNAQEMDFIMDLSDSVMNGTFIDKYIMNMDQYLSKKAVKKFFPQKI